MIGRTLGHYEITESLGAGGMGEVYRAHDTTLKRDVAIKVLPPEMASSQERLERFQREARMLAALDHPNIVHIYSVECTEDVHFLAMQLIEGKRLSELIPEVGMSLKQVFEIAIPLADALRAAHEKGVTHRDLKPGNVMVDNEGRVKILDFGLAKLRLPDPGPEASQLPTEAMTQEGLVLGTVPYMSPEQAQGKPVDHRTDIFSLGVVLYEMAAGLRPFQGENSASVISSILRDTPVSVTEVNSGLPEQLGRIIRRCLEKDPERRFQSAQDVRNELEDLRQEVATGQAVVSKTPAMAVRTAVSRPRVLAAIAIVVIVAGLVGTNAWRTQRPPPGMEAPAVASLAVLPLQNLSGDPEQEYFVDGMTEALITDLSKISALRVISRTSAMRYKGTDKSLAEIAAELDVDAVIEGSVLREGDRVGITAQLIEVATDRNLWADRYERDLISILALHGEIARAIAQEIRVTLSPQEQTLLTETRQIDPDAYEAYLKGRFHWYKLTPQEIATAQSYFEIALQKDPDYALAMVGLADAIATRGHIGLVPIEEAFPEAKGHLLTALELDDTLAEVHDMLARFYFVWDWDWNAAEREFLRAIELNPNYPDVHAVYSQFLSIVGSWDEVLPEAQKALDLDPHNLFFQSQVATRLAWLGRYDEAITEAEKMVEQQPASQVGHQILWNTYAVNGMPEKALQAAKRYFELMGNAPIVEALDRGFGEGGYPRAMELAAEAMIASSESTYFSPTEFAKLYAHAGQIDQALDWLERAVEERDTQFVYTTVMPIFADLWTEPRFQELRRRINLPST